MRLTLIGILTVALLPLMLGCQAVPVAGDQPALTQPEISKLNINATLRRVRLDGQALQRDLVRMLDLVEQMTPEQLASFRSDFLQVDALVLSDNLEFVQTLECKVLQHC